MNNAVRLIGNLGQDVNLYTFKSGNKKANVSLATSSSFKNAKGELQKETQWHNLIAWGLQAELMTKVLTKGASVVVNGSIQYRTYEDKNGKEIAKNDRKRCQNADDRSSGTDPSRRGAAGRRSGDPH